MFDELRYVPIQYVSLSFHSWKILKSFFTPRGNCTSYVLFYSYVAIEYIIIIGLSGKFLPILKENWNAEDLNFSIHLLNYID